MAAAIDETNRRRDKQVAFNLANGIDPQPIRKKIADITDMLAREDADTDELFGGGPGRGRSPVPCSRSQGASAPARQAGRLPAGDLADLVQQLTDQMHAAAADLQFELAARLRDEISDLKKELRQMVEATR